MKHRAASAEHLTSQDVAFSILAVKEHYPFSSMLTVVERVETPDTLTAIVHPEQPHPALLLVAASPMLPIMPQHVYGDGQDLQTHPANWQVVGSGPFQLVEVNEEQVVLSRSWP
jgi:peptide/nickel transport system substrate-binding protein